MKNNFKFLNLKLAKNVLMILFVLTLVSCQESKKSYNDGNNERLGKPTKLNDQFSYLVGYSMGMNFQRDSIYDANYDYLVQAIKDVLDNMEPLLTPNELDSVNTLIQEILNERNRNKLIRDKQIAEKAQEEQFNFLEENKSKKGVVTLPSGLQYKVIKPGSGKSPKLGEYVKMKAKATMLDGTPVSKPDKDDEIIYIQLKEGLLLSWLNALPLMKKGAKWTLYSPSDLAFGDKGTDEIPPNKLIVFELELLDFQAEPYPDMPEMPETPPMPQMPQQQP